MKDKEKQFKERIDCGVAYCEDTPNKQIEEKDKMYILNTILQEVKPLKLREKIYWRIVEFINKKLPEDSVVLSGKQCVEIVQDNYNIGYERGSKETAEKIYKEYLCYILSLEAKEEFAKQFNVDIKE